MKHKGQPAEAGSWRMQVSPSRAQLDDEFLVVLIPRTLHSAPPPRTRKIKLGQEYGVEIAGKATVRYRFSVERNDVRLEESGISEPIFATTNIADKD